MEAGSSVTVQLPSRGGEDELPTAILLTPLWAGESDLVVVETALPLGCVLEELDRRVLVTEVAEGSNAAVGGVLVGDVLRAVSAAVPVMKYPPVSVANRNVRVWHGATENDLERWTNPNLSRRTCSPHYGLPPCGGKSAGVAKRPRERSHPKPLTFDSRLFDGIDVTGRASVRRATCCWAASGGRGSRASWCACGRSREMSSLRLWTSSRVSWPRSPHTARPTATRCWCSSGNSRSEPNPKLALS